MSTFHFFVCLVIVFLIFATANLEAGKDWKDWLRKNTAKPGVLADEVIYSAVTHKGHEAEFLNERLHPKHSLVRVFFGLVVLALIYFALRKVL